MAIRALKVCRSSLDIQVQKQFSMVCKELLTAYTSVQSLQDTLNWKPNSVAQCLEQWVGTPELLGLIPA